VTERGFSFRADSRYFLPIAAKCSIITDISFTEDFLSPMNLSNNAENSANILADRWYESYFGPDYLFIDLHSHTDEEVEFIWKVLGLGPDSLLLDAGCGYGRHTIPLIEKGARVVGYDLSAFMLGELKKRHRGDPPCGPSTWNRAMLVRCDHRALPFHGAFDCAINMFNSFGYFAREEDNFRMLAEIAGALRPGGLFLLDLVNRDLVIRHMNRKDWFEHDGALVLEKKWFDPIENRSEIDVSVVDIHGKREYHHSIRLYSYTELRMLLEAAGFRVIAVFGGFGGEPYDPNRDRMLILSQSLMTEDE
jgi:SAM-dependent methyltransferase